MNCSHIIDQLASTSSRLAKEAILEEVLTNQADNYTFIVGAKLAFDQYDTFGVKQIPDATHSYAMSESFYEQFSDVATKLILRELTGHAARDAIAELSTLAPRDEWNHFYKNVLLKDLRCGVTVATWNKVAAKVAPEHVVPVFACQLAKDGAKEAKLSGKKFVEIKLDGVRVIAIVKGDGTVTLHSRNGKVLPNFPAIEATMSKYAIENCDIVFDGEVMSSSFQDLMKQVKRKSDVQTDDAVLYLFDSVSLDDFQRGRCDVPQRVRSELLRNTISVRDGNVQVVTSQLVDLDTDYGQKEFARINKLAISNGYEGIMLKDPDAPYESKRTKSWLKIKPFVEVTLTVVEIEEGTGKNAGRMGALVCAGHDDGVYIEVNVGTGFSEELRQEIWDNRADVVSQLVEVRADAVTQSQDASDVYSLRFPRFKCFRGFVPGEKL